MIIKTLFTTRISHTKWFFLNSYLALMVVMSASLLYPNTLRAAEQVNDSDMGDHDYIMDKQASFNFSMVQMDDAELSNVTAAGFSSFTLQDGIAKAYFNIEIATFTEIQSLKMGYYPDTNGQAGWDQDWTNVSLGSATEDLVSKGIFVEVKFSNITDSATRSLDYIKLGTPKMTGPISAQFNSFSGRIEDGTGVALVDGMRLNLGQRTIYSNNDEFYLKLSTSGSQKGWWYFWKNATIN